MSSKKVKEILIPKTIRFLKRMKNIIKRKQSQSKKWKSKKKIKKKKKKKKEKTVPNWNKYSEKGKLKKRL